ncbi:OLC1v1001064C1 [Oldenlandia corymbosa var. corymbosa]|uniref:OLC1v1001064C1 n=1 Tax=Oldenlandia corymbosa var. corymbosa TaxID=529605 RepID=A0AAV1D4H8_OLDCO|nr:OLC1v1001064C1 [Oldenlandia corymbosa var. corymbosa]
MLHQIEKVDVLDSGLSRTEDVAAAFDGTNTSPVINVEVDGNEPLAMDEVPLQTVFETDHQVLSEKDVNSGASDDGGGEERVLVAEEKGEGGEDKEENTYFGNELEGRGGDRDDDSDDDCWDDDLDDDDDDGDVFMQEDYEDDNEDDDEDEFMQEDDDDEEDGDEDEDEDEYVGLETNPGTVNRGSEGGVVGNESGKIENDEKGVHNVDEKSLEKTNGNIETESGKEENKVKGVGKLEPKLGNRMMKKKKVIEKVVRNDSDIVVSDDKCMLETDNKNDPVNGEKGHGKKKVGGKGEGSSKKNTRRLRKRDTNKKDKVNSRRVKNDFPKRAESMGMIFMCSSETKNDCYRYKVLGLPAGKRDLVEKIYRGMRLFLYDVDLKLLYGIYKAAGRGGYNIEPNAFNSKFPSQVRFTVLEDCIPLAEEKFRKVIKDNYFTKKKFDCHLNHEQVKNLCKLFSVSSKGPKPKRLERIRRAKAHRSSVHRDRSRVQVVNEVGRRDRSRTHVLEGGRHIASDDSYRRHDYYHIRSRNRAASPIDRPFVVDPVPQLINAPRYTYDRPLERDAYRQNILVERRDSYRQPLLATHDGYRQRSLSPLVPRDAYRHRPLSPLASRDYRPLSDYRDLYRQGTILDRYDAYRQDEVPEHRDFRPTSLDLRRHNDIVPARDSYLYSSRESQLYRDDPMYIAEEPDRHRHERTEYRSRVVPISEYRSTRALYRH